MSSSSPEHQPPPQAPADPTVASSAGPPNPPMPDACPECGQALAKLQDRKRNLKEQAAVLIVRHGSAVAHIIAASLDFLNKPEG